MTTLRLIFGDQLSHSLTSLEGVTHEDTIMMCEVMEEATYVKHHKKKIAFIFAAMRHFALELEEKGYIVRYIKLDDDKSGSFKNELIRAIQEIKPTSLILTEPSEYRVLEMARKWEKQFSLPVKILSDNRFLASHREFAAWSKGKKQLRMEYFYREMRRKYNILMDKDGQPIGGQWNYDKENRKILASFPSLFKRLSHKKDVITRDVLSLVETRFQSHIGLLEPFHYALTREQAVKELEDFLIHYLPLFGDYQDVMVKGEPYLYHSLLSSYINIGLLLPLEVCQKAEEQYHKGKAPLNSVEGFIRQILGWREYIRGIYWQFMPDYREMNALNATRSLPSFYWDANTKMRCVKEAVTHTLEHAYSHHIQRLMITGNFALLAGLDVKEVQKWYLAVYSDAFEWVEMPNTLGMSLFGDGGIVASKPYAASGKYIDKMSNFCSSCFYNPNETTGEKACPFNALYWDFMVRNEKVIKHNQRMSFVMATWKKFSPSKQTAILEKAKEIFKELECQKV